MRKTKNTHMARLHRLLSPELDNLSMDVLVSEVKSLSPTKRRLALSICKEVLRRKGIGRRENDAIRGDVIRVIAAASPHSVRIMQQLLRNTAGRDDYEIHFTLFCCLGWMPNSRELCSPMLNFVKDYLLRVKAKTAQAAWMAADLLGHHWSSVQTLPVLMQVAKRARYVAGREAAITGLAKAAENTKISTRTRREIISLLQVLSENDRSASVRLAAASVLKLQRSGTKL